MAVFLQFLLNECARRSTGRNTSSFADRRALDASPRHGQRIALLRATAATVSVPKHRAELTTLEFKRRVCSTSNEKLLGAKGIATRSKDATSGSWQY